MSLVDRKNVAVGAFGAGARPVLKFTGPLVMGNSIITTGSSSNQVAIENLTFDSIYTTGYEGMPDAVGVGGTDTSIRNCQFLNLSNAINANVGPRGVLAVDNTAPVAGNIRGYFAWVQGTDQVYLGNYAADSKFQHVLRATAYSRLLIAKNNFTNLVTNGVIKGTLTIHRGEYVYIDGNTLNDG